MNQDQGLVNVRGVPHYYEWVRLQPEKLHKPVMVFIHGWAGSGKYWHTTADALKGQFDCLLYDMRGFGRSRLPSSCQLGYELEEYAEDLACFLKALELETVYLNSHSMGASIATLFANRYPQLVNKVILTCNGIFEYDEKAFKAFHRFGGYVVKFRYSWFLKVPGADRLFMARFLHRPIAKNLRKDFLEDFLLADYQAALGTIYTSVSKKAVELMPTEFAQLQVPTLLIAGEKDQIIPAAMGKEAAALSEMIQYAELPNTSHFPMLEDAPNYIQTVKEFLAV